jgi:hypothetical protein
MDSTAVRMQESIPVAHPFDPFQPVDNTSHPFAMAEIVPMSPSEPRTSYNDPFSMMHATAESSRTASNSSYIPASQPSTQSQQHGSVAPGSWTMTPPVDSPTLQQADPFSTFYGSDVATAQSHASQPQPFRADQAIPDIWISQAQRQHSQELAVHPRHVPSPSPYGATQLGHWHSSSQNHSNGDIGHNQWSSNASTPSHAIVETNQQTPWQCNQLQPAGHSQNSSLTSSYVPPSSAPHTLSLQTTHNGLSGQYAGTRTSSAHASGARTEEQGYRFGDLTRSIVAKGKKTSGRNEQDGYKFGDFTRGLFSK